MGTGRCGSTLLHELLCRHPDVGFMSNLDDLVPGGHRLARWNGRAYRRLPVTVTRKGRLRVAPSEGYRALAREVGPLLVEPHRDLTADDAMPWLTRRFERFVLARATRVDESTFVHKLTGWPRAGFLHAVFPQARFVHVVRDGRAVASSWLQTSWWRGHHGPGGWRWGELPPPHRETWERSGRDHAVLAGLAWMILLDAWEDARAHLPCSAWIDVRYEDLLSVQRRSSTAFGSSSDSPRPRWR